MTHPIPQLSAQSDVINFRLIGLSSAKVLEFVPPFASVLTRPHSRNNDKFSCLFLQLEKWAILNDVFWSQTR